MVKIHADDGSPVSVDTSIGISIANSAVSLNEVLDETDKFLYEAKRNGRNCIWHRGKQLLYLPAVFASGSINPV